MLQAHLITDPAGVIALLNVGCDVCDLVYSQIEQLDDPVVLTNAELYILAREYLLQEMFNFDAHGVPTCSKCFINITPRLSNEWLTEALNIEKVSQQRYQSLRDGVEKAERTETGSD